MGRELIEGDGVRRATQREKALAVRIERRSESKGEDNCVETREEGGRADHVLGGIKRIDPLNPRAAEVFRRAAAAAHQTRSESRERERAHRG